MATEIIQRFSLHSKEMTLYFCLTLSMLNNKKSLPSLIRYTMHNNFSKGQYINIPTNVLRQNSLSFTSSRLLSMI